jgi:hypothetical protein
MDAGDVLLGFIPLAIWAAWELSRIACALETIVDEIRGRK